jgi:hypothetical protein
MRGQASVVLMVSLYYRVVRTNEERMEHGDGDKCVVRGFRTFILQHLLLR